jgi:hypothetical protein
VAIGELLLEVFVPTFLHAETQGSIALAFQNLSPIEVCQHFSRALERPCKYAHDSKIQIRTPVPTGYKEQLAGIEILFGQLRAPYFPGPEFDFSKENKDGKVRKLTREARELWRGYRGIEEYAREVFPVEEEANGMDWMIDKMVT